MPNTSISETTNKDRSRDNVSISPVSSDNSRDELTKTKEEQLENISLYRQIAYQNNRKVFPETKDRILRSIRAGATLQDAAIQADIHPTTLARHIRNDGDFATKVGQALVGFKGKHIRNIDTFSKVDWKASQFLLASKFPTEYAQRGMLAINSKSEITIRLDNTGYISPSVKQVKDL